MNGLIDIRGIHGQGLLERLWHAAKFVDPCIGRHRPQWDMNASMMACDEDGYVDVAQGKVIRCSIYADAVNPYEYDKHNGEGTFQRVVNEMRWELAHANAAGSVDRDVHSCGRD
jgi:predicted amino acid dehydrogenase